MGRKFVCRKVINRYVGRMMRDLMKGETRRGSSSRGSKVRESCSKPNLTGTGGNCDATEVFVGVKRVLILGEHIVVFVSFLWRCDLGGRFNDTDDGVLHNEIFLVVGRIAIHIILIIGFLKLERADAGLHIVFSPFDGATMQAEVCNTTA